MFRDRKIRVSREVTPRGVGARYRDYRGYWYADLFSLVVKNAWYRRKITEKITFRDWLSFIIHSVRMWKVQNRDCR
jgi:hypothetical protein